MNYVGTTGRRVVKGFVVEIRRVPDLNAPVTVVCEGQMRLVGKRWLGTLRVTDADDRSMIGDLIQINLPLDSHKTTKSVGNYFYRLMVDVFPELEVGCVYGTMELAGAA